MDSVMEKEKKVSSCTLIKTDDNKWLLEYFKNGDSKRFIADDLDELMEKIKDVFDEPKEKNKKEEKEEFNKGWEKEK